MGLVVALVLALLGSPTVVRAQGGEVTLVAALSPELAACVTTDELRKSYAEMVAAHGGEGAQAPALRLRVTERAGSRVDRQTHVLDVSVSSAGRELGTRTLPVKTGDCDALPDTLALVLVLLAQTAPPAPVPEQAPRELSPAPSLQPLAASVAVSAGASMAWGVLPHVAFGLQLKAAAVWQPVSLRLAASAYWPQTLAVAEGSVRWQSYELALEACSAALQPSERFAVRLCGGPRAGWMLARSERFALQTKGAGVALLYLGLVPEVSLRLGEASWLELGAGIALALTRPRFFVALDAGDRVRVFDNPAALRAELALSWTQMF